MSFKSIFHLDGKKYNVLQCSYDFHQNSDVNGRPSGKPILTRVSILLEVKDITVFLLWAISPTMQKQFILEYLPRIVGTKGRKIYGFDVNCVKYDEVFSANSKSPMTVRLELTCGGFEEGNAKYSTTWRKTYNDTTTVKPINYNEQEKEPKITKINWINAETNKKIKEIPYDEKVGLQIEIRDAEGGTATIVIKKEDGNDLEPGKTELTFTEAVDEDGIVTIAPFLIERVWEETKVPKYDYLVAKVTYNDITKESKEIKLIPFPQIVVDFRPEDKYKGEYGFDYLRDKQGGKKDRVTYKKIMGTNKDNSSGENVFTKYPTDAKFNDLKKTHYPLTDKDGNTIKLDWYKDFEGNQLEYTQSHLTIYPEKSVILSLQLETLENPKELTFKYDKNYFTLNKQTIPAQSKGKKRLKDFLTITCNKEFTKDQLIKVMYKDRLLGQLNVLKNDKANRKKVKVVFVKVESELSLGNKLYGKTSLSGKSEKDMLERLLKQAYIKLELDEIEFSLLDIDPSTNKPKYPDFNTDYTLKDVRPNKNNQKIINKFKKGTKTQINVFMEEAFNKAHPKYKDYYKVFFFGDIGGRKDAIKQIVQLGGFAKKIKSKSVSVFKERKSTDVTHEVLHAIGLYHSFKNNDYDFKKGATKNIMDYASNKNHTWYWQWKKLWANKQILKE